MRELVPPLIVEALRHGLPIMDRRWQRPIPAGGDAGRPRGARQLAGADLSATTTRRETPGMAGLYPVGEGAGYAGGIVSAAVDGLRSAKAIMAKYAALESKKS